MELEGENLANDHKLAKFKPSKFYFSNTSRAAEAQLATLSVPIDKLEVCDYLDN